MKIWQTLGLLFVSAQALAIPARIQAFRALMSDGTYQTIRFCGDENRSFFVSEDGYIVNKDTANGCYVKTGMRLEDVQPASAKRSGVGSTNDVALSPKGSPKIPVILVNFSDLKFSLAETDAELQDYYDKYCNGTRDGILYTGSGSRGSVRDYFVQQSDSLFLPEFHIIGPVTLENPMAYYGANINGQTDYRYSIFRDEALKAAMVLEPDFGTIFDNDGNGTVDLAFFIYAGLPESDHGVTEDAIWPKEMVTPTVINGVTVAVSACGSEQTMSSRGATPIGIGTMCHEVSHAIGLPDEYDTQYYTSLGMSYWSLMDSGNFWEAGREPCGYTAYERDFVGWRPLQTLDGSTTVRLKPLENGGTGYKVVNDENPDEYYVLENRQDAGWDSALGRRGHGMLVVHVDYDRTAWTTNRLNTNKDHQRMTFIPANSRYVGNYNATSGADLFDAISGQAYPGTSGNTSLTNDSEPAALVFTSSNGFMNKPITQIRELDNGDVVFKFMPKGTLEAPRGLNAVEVGTRKFTLAWENVENADCYKVEIYGVSEDASSGDELVAEIDSVNANRCDVEIGDEALTYACYACRVCALHNEFEDSPYSDTLHVQLEPDAVRQARTEENTPATVYSINGTRLPVSADEVHSLSKGIYIIRRGVDTQKIIID